MTLPLPPWDGTPETAQYILDQLAMGALTSPDLSGRVLELSVGGTKRRIAFGTAGVNFPGAANSDVTTITHNMGVTPVIVLAMTTGSTGDTTNQANVYWWDTPTTTTFKIRGQTASGAAIGPGAVNISWIAIG